MAEHILRREQIIELPIEETFQFFADAGNLEKITPPELNFRIITGQPIDIKKGTLIDYRLKLRGFPITWRTEITRWEPPHAFIDMALKSPYKQWIHLHEFSETEDGKTRMIDEVKYRLPLEPLGDIGHFMVKKELKYIFDYRAKVVADLLG